MGNLIDPIAKKRALIEAAKAKAAAASQALEKTPIAPIEFGSVEDAVNRIRIIADNSSSMGTSKMEDAKKGIVECLRNGTPNKDAFAIHLLNSYLNNWRQEESGSELAKCIANSTLEVDLIKLAIAVDSKNVVASGGTPLYERILDAQAALPKATRYIAFSDGEPNNTINEEKVIEQALRDETPIDTVFFGSSDYAADIMKRLADKTGGIFLKFDPAKGVDFKTAFKYLAPVKRMMLMSAQFKEDLQNGRIKA